MAVFGVVGVVVVVVVVVFGMRRKSTRRVLPIGFDSSEQIRLICCYF